MEKDDITPKMREEISHHFREQLTYYEDIKPWKLYLRQKLLETVRRQKGFTPTSKLAKDYFKNNDNNQNMTTYFAETAQLATAIEMETELDNFPSNYRVIQDAAMHMSQATIPTVDPNWVPTEDLERDFFSTHKESTDPLQFVLYWYSKIDKEKKVPLYHLYRKRYYDWVGNEALYKTSVSAFKHPKHAWRPLLKQMVKNKKVVRLYFQQHAILKAHLVSEAIFEGQWYCY